MGLHRDFRIRGHLKRASDHTQHVAELRRAEGRRRATPKIDGAQHVISDGPHSGVKLDFALETCEIFAHPIPSMNFQIERAKVASMVAEGHVDVKTKRHGRSARSRKI